MDRSKIRFPAVGALAFTLLAWTAAFAAEEPDCGPLCEAVNGLLGPLQKKGGAPFTVTLKAAQRSVKPGEAAGAPVPQGEAVFAKQAGDHFSLSVRYQKLAFELTRTPDELRLWLPAKQTLIVSKGTLTRPDEAFTLDRVLAGILAAAPDYQSVFELVEGADAQSILAVIQAAGCRVAPAARGDGSVDYHVTQGQRALLTLSVDAKARALASVGIRGGKGEWVLMPEVKDGAAMAKPPPTEEVKNRIEVDRGEFERALLRGLVRAAEIKWEDTYGLPPKDQFVAGEHGYYRVKEGQRIVKLAGEPREIGAQHGRFLAKEVRKMVDSTLYVVGTVYTVEKGRWFLDEIRAATRRLEKFVPADQVEEIKGLAEGSGVPYEEVWLASYFPELFHCSGFALQGKATVGGKLYHGRILDYMIEVGMQRCAVLFVVEKKGKIPFANVGYAGFVGSVSGMNAQKVSLGEMGGRGEGNWDGVPMAILMRMALEDARTLADAKRIFNENPRTCEYYYVFADGKDRSAVAVAATPEKIEFLGPGQAHTKLPTPIEDCVVLSAGNRYKLLCQRVQESFGQINDEKALKLMDAPVAMANSNLHSVLFVPEDLVLYVANAGRNGPAYKEKCYRYALEELLKDAPPKP